MAKVGGRNKPSLIFIDDDQKEIEQFKPIVVGHYQWEEILWPHDRGKLFSLSRPDIFVSDLYLPPVTGDLEPTKERVDAATAMAQNVAHLFSEISKRLPVDLKIRGRGERLNKQKECLRETMGAILCAYDLLKMQWSGREEFPGNGLGQSPVNGIQLLKEVRAHHRNVSFVFYSAKITPEDVIKVLQEGAADAIRKRTVKGNELLNRLERALTKKIFE